MEMFVTLCSAFVIPCSSSCVLWFQGSFEVILCFGAWWHCRCWRLFMFIWCLAQIAHLPFTCAAPGTVAPPAMPVGTCAAFRKEANLSPGFHTICLTAHLPHDPCLLCTHSIKEEKDFQDLVFDPTFRQHLPDSSP